MVKPKNDLKFLKIRSDNDKTQMILDIFFKIKESSEFTVKGVSESTGIDNAFVAGYFNACVNKKLLQTAGNSIYGENLKFSAQTKKVMGIGFREDNCFITVIDIAGNIVSKENIKIEVLLSGKGKRKDISMIVKEISAKTMLNSGDLLAVAVAMPEEMIDINPKSSEILVNGIKDVFKCPVYATKSATASGYGNREFSIETKGKDVLYMHSDIGIGVVFKKEMIFEADEYSEEKNGAYLRPWNQFSIVNATKELILRGVGTEVVEMVKGDVERITLNTVLEAAEKKDELAEDLVKRSGLALGVRVAYLINMFNAKFVLFGGGTEKAEGRFIPHVMDSMNRFISKDVLNELRIVPGVLGESASSIGAALLCRREIFMEV
ncbi:MAG TPA: ROK family protein [Candidatus Omnitrophota bacterium]|nr:ROK family protein [Candidatus Omnitrophota bacterium]HPS19918.1 ROK family protein [Candidatus Omnitrophota bacterium]